MLKRPQLNEVELTELTGIIVTMSEGQWDGLLQAAYDSGHTLLELDKNERFLAMYRLPQA